MLESRGMEDDLGLVVVENGLERLVVANVAQHHVIGVEEADAVDVQLGGVQRRLVTVEQDQLAGAKL